MDDPENEPDLRFFPVGATVRAGGRLGHVIAVLKRGGRQVRFMDNAETAEFDVSALELWRICDDELADSGGNMLAPDLREFPVGASVLAGGRLASVTRVLPCGVRQVKFAGGPGGVEEFGVDALELWRLPAPQQAEPPAESPQSALDIQVGGDHYKTMKIQPIQYILANNLGFVEGAVVKYVSRWKVKGEGVTDLKKARHFLDLLIQHEEGK